MESRGVSLVEITSDSPWKKGQSKPLLFLTNILCNALSHSLNPFWNTATSGFQIIDATI